LWRKIQEKKFVVSVEIDPPRGAQLERTFEQVKRIMASGHVDAIDINSGSMARVGMDALQLAGALAAEGIETIPHLTTRDSNLIGLQATLLGAWAVGGVRNVLAITGDPPSLGDHPESSGVYEIDSIGLVDVMARLNRGTDWAGKALGGATNFTIGAALNPVADDLEYEIERYHAKVEAGVHFLMTQPVFDPEHWRAFEKRIGGKCAVPVMLGIWPLVSYKQAVRLNNEVPGIVIPQAVLEELEAAGAAALGTGGGLYDRAVQALRGCARNICVDAVPKHPHLKPTCGAPWTHSGPDNFRFQKKKNLFFLRRAPWSSRETSSCSGSYGSGRPSNAAAGLSRNKARATSSPRNPATLS
jgi:5,10-methylenetetrahydrofolate reductase